MSGLFIVFNRRVRLNVNIAINFISMVLGVVHEVDLNLNSFKKPRFQVFRLVWSNFYQKMSQYSSESQKGHRSELNPRIHPTVPLIYGWSIPSSRSSLRSSVDVSSFFPRTRTPTRSTPKRRRKKEEVFPSAGKHQVHLILISFVCGISFFPKKLRPDEGREPDQARWWRHGEVDFMMSAPRLPRPNRVGGETRRTGSLELAGRVTDFVVNGNIWFN